MLSYGTQTVGSCHLFSSKFQLHIMIRSTIMVITTPKSNLVFDVTLTLLCTGSNAPYEFDNSVLPNLPGFKFNDRLQYSNWTSFWRIFSVFEVLKGTRKKLLKFHFKIYCRKAFNQSFQEKTKKGAVIGIL